MIYSMTGFGKAQCNIQNTVCSIEVKALNSKQLDMFLRLPAMLKNLEIDMRKVLGDLLMRGKVEVNIAVQKQQESGNVKINVEALKEYQQQLKGLDIAGSNLLGSLLKLPNVVNETEDELSDEDKEIVLKALEAACEDLMTFRKQEGKALANDLKSRVEQIKEYKEDIVVLAPLRIERMRKRMHDNFKNYSADLNANEERFEQELMFYIEKLDITEEFVRLDSHNRYFIETLQSDTIDVGKKLNFISQEMGREINTIGSKANDAEIQKLVVQMKDELEKIKEQINNIL